MTSDVKLLPCPFCGERANLHAAEDEDSTHWWAQCSVCGAVSGERLAESTPDREFAIAAWNTRAPNAEHEALLRRVESLRDAGSALANIAYNLAQYDEVPAPEREILDAARRRWDVAMKGEGQRVRILAEPVDAP